MIQNDGEFFLMLHVRCEFAAALLQAVGMLWLSSRCLFCSGSKLKEQPVFGAYCSHHLISEDKEQKSWHKDRMAPFRHGVWPIDFHVICPKQVTCSVSEWVKEMYFFHRHHYKSHGNRQGRIIFLEKRE